MSEDAIGQMFEKAQGRIVHVNLKFNEGSNFAGMRLSKGVVLIAHETEHVCFCSVRWAVLAGLEGTSWCPASDDAVVGACNAWGCWETPTAQVAETVAIAFEVHACPRPIFVDIFSIVCKI